MTRIESLEAPSSTARDVLRFIVATKAQDIPEEVLQTTALYLLDCLGVLAAAGQLDAGRIARQHAVDHWAAGPDAPSARIAFDGRRASLPGAAFAMATQLDNLDAHDGWQASKGHAGAALVPALISVAQAQGGVTGRDALAGLAVGYEVSNYAASALHATVSDYHTSGAWNALGCVAVAAQLLGMTEKVTRQALGIAEYHGPRSQMMREIANPTMLHDGSGLGAPVGVYAALIAQDGFLGAPAATVEFSDAAAEWDDLGTIWRVMEQYIKPYPICRWAHAPIDGALLLREKHALNPAQIAKVEIESFRYAADLTCEIPGSPQEAQYAMAWPVACALVRGRVGVTEILPEALRDPELHAMVAKITSHASDIYESGYPEARRAEITITLMDGASVASGPLLASGGPDPQPTEQEVVDKFRAYAGTVLPEARVDAIADAVLGLTSADANFHDLLELIYAP